MSIAYSAEFRVGSGSGKTHKTDPDSDLCVRSFTVSDYGSQVRLTYWKCTQPMKTTAWYSFNSSIKKTACPSPPLHCTVYANEESPPSPPSPSRLPSCCCNRIPGIFYSIQISTFNCYIIQVLVLSLFLMFILLRIFMS